MPGQQHHKNQHRFTVWAPEKEQVQLHIVAPFDASYAMQKDEWGYFSVDVETPHHELQYYFKPDGEKDYPDPKSQYQPQGVHGPSQTVDHAQYQWQDGNWKGLPLEELIIYEIHVGTFTPEGTFEAIIPRLKELKKSGINALELMPITQFPGGRNWGYDGVFPYAVQNTYGGHEGLKKLVDACHQHGIAVFLDVVYNHLGPEGNYFSQFGPYFTDQYCTPWGDAINFDGAWSDGVRDYFSDNVVYWFGNYHIDGLRCDAIHMVFDSGAVHFWELTNSKVKALEERLGRSFHLIAESDLNSPKVIKEPQEGGYGFSAQWLDDFHHALYVLINPADKERYYDFGSMEQLAKAYRDGFVHSGEWVKFRKRKHGASSAGVPGDKFVVFNQNHDQIGNRVGGERLCMLVDFERVKLAAAAIMLAPYVPMLFMGEEYADDTPFFYFVSHSDPDLIKAVQEGRKEEFKDFGFDNPPPDPQEESTFQQSKIHWNKRNKKEHRIMLHWHEELITMRKTFGPLKNFQKRDVRVEVLNEKVLALFRQTASAEERLLCLFHFAESQTELVVPDMLKTATKILDSKAPKWMLHDPGDAAAPGKIKAGQTISLAPWQVVVYKVE